MPTADTKHTILDAAEALFAEQGFAATSLRQLTTRAGTNLAAVNYHFGSKDELAKAVLLRRIEPINAERLRRLDRLGKRATLDAVVRAFLEPVLCSGAMAAGPATAAGGDPAGFCRMFGRIMVEQPPFLREFLGRQFRTVASRFIAALSAAAPAIDATTLWWRLHFMVGALAHTLQNAHLVGEMSAGACPSTAAETIVEELVTFAVAGFASATPADGQARTTGTARAAGPRR